MTDSTAMAGANRPKVAVVWMIAVALAMLALTLFCLWQSNNTLVGMYANVDGRWAAWNVQDLIAWNGPFDFSPFDPLAGTGSLFLPNLPWLNPGAWAFATSWPTDIKYAVSYGVYFIEFGASSYFLFREIGASRLQAFLSAQLLTLFFPPFSALPNVLSWMSLAPVNAHLFAMCNIALLALLRIRAVRETGNYVWIAVFAAAVFIAFSSGPITILTYVPVYGFFFVLLLFAKPPNRSDIIIKAVVLALVAIAFVAAGGLDYILTTSRLSARSSGFDGLLPSPVVPPEVEETRVDFWLRTVCRGQYAQFLLCPTAKFSVFQIAALTGAAYLALTRSGLRVIAIGYLVLICAIHMHWAAWLFEKLGPFNSINSAFFAWSAYPFLAFFIGAGVIQASTSAMNRVRYSGHPTILVVPALLAAYWFGISGSTQPPPSRAKQEIGLLPPASTIYHSSDGAVLTALGQAISIAPGEPFKGRAATHFSSSNGWLSTELHLPEGVLLNIASRRYLQRWFGTTFQETDLWSLEIPTFEEYGQWVSTDIITFAAAFLAERQHRISPSFLQVYQLDLPILRLLGIRFLITDAELSAPGARLIVSQSAEKAPGSIQLYELDRPNLGSYSPTKIVLANTFAETIRLMGNNAERLETVGVSTQPPEGPLVKASQSEMSFVSDGWRLQAKSTGRSIIAVPVRYSRCWALEGAPPGIRLYRGNAVQTFVEFKGAIDVTARLNFGPFGNMGCRKQDVEDLKALRP